MTDSNDFMTSEGLSSIADVAPRKYCMKCEQWLPTLDNYTFYAGTKDGFTRICNACEKVRSRAYTKATKLEFFRIYGGQCEWPDCDVTDPDLLEIDHVNNDGKADRIKENPATQRARVARSGKRLEDVQLQLLCKSHHRMKTNADFPGYMDWLFDQHFASKEAA